ncbi:MAG TPA: peptidoglycan-binding protein [Nocardioidaceae bacterium]|jgi:N-acetylmuramoyl-L-alanine amidase|nr:peptidoglycan-binding protein [Nocardioidaceae bacterium]
MSDISRPDVRTAGPTTGAYALGDAGDAVADIRARLARLGLLGDGAGPGLPQAAVFDHGTDSAVRSFQQQRGLDVDGVVGPDTYRALEEAHWRLGDRVLTHVPGNLTSGDDVVRLQQRLLDLGFPVGRVDGLFGSSTERAVREFQRNVGLPPDGTCGPATLKALGRLAPLVRGGQPNALRAEEQIRRAGPQLSGKVVVIDAAPVRATDPVTARRAAEITTDLARRVEGRLVATGVQAFLTGHPAPESERAEFANRTDANLSVSVQLDAAVNPDVSGVSAYYYGSDVHGVRSTAGERFAGLVQREIVARTDLADLRTHPKTWDFLRRTSMPAVRVGVGYITNPGDAARLGDPAFRDVVAEAIVVAVQRVYLTPDVDSRTGVLRLSELRAAVRQASALPPA